MSISLAEGGQGLPASNTIGSVLNPSDMTGPAYPIADDDDGNIFLEEGGEGSEDIIFTNEEDGGEDDDDDDDDKDGDDDVAIPTLTPVAPSKKTHKQRHHKNDRNKDDGEKYTTRSEIIPEVNEGGDDKESGSIETEKTTATNVMGTTNKLNDNGKDQFFWKTLDWGQVRIIPNFMYTLSFVRLFYTNSLF